MNIRTLTVGLISTNCYLIVNDGRCVVIDPGAEGERILNAAAGLPIEAVLLTHGHFDHIAGLPALLDAEEKAGRSPKVLIHLLDAPMLGNSTLNASYPLLRRHITVPAPTGYVRDAAELELAGLKFSVMHTPGHTQGSVCYFCENHLFSGDTLFRHGWGRTDLHGGSQTDMNQSLRKLLPLSRTMELHPGHED